MNVVIIGNGISGITAARWVRKLSDYNITVISSETKYFYSRTALMYIYMGHMRQQDTQPYEEWFWEKNRIDLLEDHVVKIDFDSKHLSLKKGTTIEYDKLILALGSKSNKFGWPGQDLQGVRGLYNLQDLEVMEEYSEGLQRAVVVGGGLIGIEMAEMFTSRQIPVTMIVREQQYWDNVLPKEEAKLISDHIIHHGIDLRLGVNLGEILDDGNGKACGVIIKETGEKIDCGYVGLTAGVSPNVDFLKDSSLEIQKGIVVNDFLETNKDSVYAIGDCAQLSQPKPGRRSIEAVWYTGRMMGEIAAHNICGKRVTYDPGIWFNSAKFLDIEYQVYGDVPANQNDETESLMWAHPNGDKLIRLLYHRQMKNVTGVNLLRVRFRHEVCEKWLREKSSIEDVLQNLKLADFNPEFCKDYTDHLLNAYFEKTGLRIKPKARRSLDQVLSFLKS